MGCNPQTLVRLQSVPLGDKMFATEDDINEHMRAIAILEEEDAGVISNCEVLQMAVRFGRTYGFDVLGENQE